MDVGLLKCKMAQIFNRLFSYKKIKYLIMCRHAIYSYFCVDLRTIG